MKDPLQHIEKTLKNPRTFLFTWDSQGFSFQIFEDEFIKATPVAGFAGSVQHVTEKPGFGLQVAENQQPPKDDLPLETLFKNNNIDDSDVDEPQTPTGIASRIQQRIALKKTSQNDFRSRLKSRFDRFKARQSEENIGRGSVSQISVSGRAGTYTLF